MDVGEYIYHRGDTDTFIRFQDDSITFQAGNQELLTLTEAAQDEVVVNENNNAVDFRVESSYATHMFYVDGTNHRIGIGTNSPQSVLHIVDPVDASSVPRDAVLIMKSKKETGIKLIADSGNDNPDGENNNPFVDFYQDGQSDTSGRNQRVGSIALEGNADATFTGSLANAFFMDCHVPSSANSARPLQLANDSVNGGHAARITLEGTNGYVGIHTNTPAHSLTVNGDTSITGTLMIANPLTASAFYSFPTAEGTANQVLAATGVGGLIFSDLATLMPQCMTIAVTEENTNIQTGTAQVTIRSPYSIGITDVRGSLSTASTSGVVEFDVNVDGTSIFTTEATIDANETTTQSAAVASAISGSVAMVGDDSVITIDIDSAGTGARGLKVTLYYTRMS